MTDQAPSKKAPARPNLLWLVGFFITIYTFQLALAPGIRTHDATFQLEWTYALPWFGWLAGILILDFFVKSRLPARDPWLVPLVGALTGWGLLTIWRLSPSLGLKQLIWFLVSIVVVVVGLNIKDLIAILKRYKYFWLVLGLILVALTFIIGVNPSDSGPNLWLNLFGVYIQPSEPLKLLMIVYLAAFFADQIRPNVSVMSSILPTVLITGLVGLLLIGQRDLGTASLFVCLYVFMLAVTTRRRRFLWIFPLIVLAAGVAGYFLFDVVRARVDIWLNPWLETTGASYQLVQAQIAVAVGGLTGTGPGLGSPQLIPVAVSDFIFSAIGEETGLLGTSALILMILLLIFRGITIAQNTKTTFGRYLAFGISAYFAIQSFFIIGGNLGLVPLTGITLPFVSYGGSSLLTSMICVLILLKLSTETSKVPFSERSRRPYHFLSAVVLVLYILLLVKNSAISVFNQEDLVNRPENPRWAVYDRYSPRGNIMTQAGEELSITTGTSGTYDREVLYPQLSNVLGYTNALYGQTGLENSIYSFLRGYGKSYQTYWRHQVLYNQPPPGSDVKLNISLSLQKTADELLADQKGAIVLLNAKTGEVYALASHPNYDANTLEENWATLMASADAPLVNRTTQASYPIGTLANLFSLTTYWSDPAVRFQLPAMEHQMDLQCYRAIKAANADLNGLQYGCKSTTEGLLQSVSGQDLTELMRLMGLFSAPTIALEVAPPHPDPSLYGDLSAWLPRAQETTVSPLQMALVAATFTNDGVQPAPKLVNSYLNEKGEWIAFADSGDPIPVIETELARRVRDQFQSQTQSIWFQNGHATISENETLTWYIGGTTPAWTGTPLAIAIAIEGSNPELTQQIGSQLLSLTTNP
ncbi:MAG: FtsW/RodA/SpoVE family cell cycle protein [Anaerolineaceae bacterium]